MSDQIPASLKGLRVRVVAGPETSAPIEQVAYGKLKKLLAEHGQHLSEKTLAPFRKSLTALLLHNLRAREVEPAKASSAKNAPDESWIRFEASDGRMYQAHLESWPKVQKRAPGARQVEKKAAFPRTEPKKPLLKGFVRAGSFQGLGNPVRRKITSNLSFSNPPCRSSPFVRRTPGEGLRRPISYNHHPTICATVDC